MPTLSDSADSTYRYSRKEAALQKGLCAPFKHTINIRIFCTHARAKSSPVWRRSRIYRIAYLRNRSAKMSSKGGSGELLSMSFNQDASCISVGTPDGYRIFNCQPFGRNIFSTDGGIGIVKMLYCTSLVCLVGGGKNPAFSPR